MERLRCKTFVVYFLVHALSYYIIVITITIVRIVTSRPSVCEINNIKLTQKLSPCNFFQFCIIYWKYSSRLLFFDGKAFFTPNFLIIFIPVWNFALSWIFAVKHQDVSLRKIWFSPYLLCGEMSRFSPCFLRGNDSIFPTRANWWYVSFLPCVICGEMSCLSPRVLRGEMSLSSLCLLRNEMSLFYRACFAVKLLTVTVTFTATAKFLLLSALSNIYLICLLHRCVCAAGEWRRRAGNWQKSP